MENLKNGFVEILDHRILRSEIYHYYTGIFGLTNCIVIEMKNKSTIEIPVDANNKAMDGIIKNIDNLLLETV